MISRCAALVALFVLTWSVPAEAGPIAAAFSAVATWFGGLGVAAQALIRLGLGLALSALQRAKIEDRPTRQSVSQTLSGGINPDAFVIGTYATGGAFACPHHTHESDRGRLTMVFDLGGVPIEGLEGVIVNGEAVTLRPDWVSGPTVWEEHSGNEDIYGTPVEEYTNVLQSLSEIPIYADNRVIRDLSKPDASLRLNCVLFVRSYDGRQTAADPDLVEIYGEDPDYPITSDMIGRERPYAIVTAKGWRERMDSVPDVRFVLKGIRLYDPRRDSSVGGVGAQRHDNPESWAWSDNPMVAIYNILRGIPVGPDTFGGVAEAADLPLSNWFAAMNACDEPVVEAGGTVRRYRCGYEVTVDQEPFAVIEELKAACAGDVCEVGGAFYAHVGEAAAPTFFFTDDDVIITEPQDETPFPGLDQTVNGVSITHPSPAQNWEETQTILYRDDLEIEDDARRLVEDLSISACPYPVQAQRLAQAFINDARRFRRHTVSFPPDAAHLRPYSVVRWTSERFGYGGKDFELQGGALDPLTYVARFALREVDPSDFGWNSGDEIPVETATPSRTYLDFAAPTVQFQAVAVPDSQGRSRRPAIWAYWDGLERHDVQLRFKGETALTHRANGVANDEGGVLFVGDILPGETYEGRGRLTRERVGAAWGPWQEVTAPDVRLTELDLADALRARVDRAFERHDETLARVDDKLDEIFELQIAEAELVRQELVQLGNTSAGYFEGLETRIEEGRLAEISARQQLVASIDQNSAQVLQLQGAKVDAQGAIAAVETQISAEFGGLQAMAQAVTFAEATIDGISAGYVLRLNGQGVFEVVNVADGTGGGTTTAFLGADYVRITGIAQLDTAVIEDLVVENAFIENLTVGTSNITQGSVSQTEGGTFTYSGGDLNFVQVYTFLLPGPFVNADLIGGASFNVIGNGGNPGVRIFVNGALEFEHFGEGLISTQLVQLGITAANISVSVQARQCDIDPANIWLSAQKR